MGKYFLYGASGRTKHNWQGPCIFTQWFERRSCEASSCVSKSMRNGYLLLGSRRTTARLIHGVDSLMQGCPELLSPSFAAVNPAARIIGMGSLGNFTMIFSRRCIYYGKSAQHGVCDVLGGCFTQKRGIADNLMVPKFIETRMILCEAQLRISLSYCRSITTAGRRVGIKGRMIQNN